MRRIPLGKPQERRAIGDADRGTVENEVDAGERDGDDDAVRVPRQILSQPRGPLVDRLSDGRGSGCVWPPTGTAERHRDLTNLKLVQHTGRERPLARVLPIPSVT
jgi:hypothetical protein